MSRVVAVTQPYVPAYRVPLFNELSRRLREHDLELHVYSSAPTGEQAERGDSATGSWHRSISVRQLRVLRWDVKIRKSPRGLRDAALLITELEALNVLAWRDVFRSRPTVLWGHGKGFVNHTGSLSDFVESVLAAKASHVMTYSPEGRDHVLLSGRVRPRNVSAIGNSTDSLLLRNETVRLLDGRREKPMPPHVLYVGGLDRSKRIDFLVDAYEHGVRTQPDLKLTVVGKGADVDLITDCASRHPGVRYVPDARGERLAQIAIQAHAMWIPGRVGLVAVDALALGLPVHTTRYEYHAPEIGFLRDKEVEYLDSDPKAFAEQSLSLIHASPNVLLRDDFPTIQLVVDNMMMVILRLLDGEPNDRG